MQRADRPVSRVLDEALRLIYYDGWVWRGTVGTPDQPGYDLGAALNLANHGHVVPTDEVPELPERQRRRGADAFRVVLDVIFEGDDHATLEPRRARRKLERWQDQFARQESEVTAALRRACREAERREEIGLLR